MAMARKLIPPVFAILCALSLGATPPASGQVSPAEVINPRLKALEAANLDKLKDLNNHITAMTFPFPFALRRFVGLDHGNRQDADSRGLEFVKFHDHTILKISGNYAAAFNTDLLSPNERAEQVMDAVIMPILPLLPNYLPDQPAFDGFGFEISYHVRTHNKQFGYEGRENLAVVFDKADVPAFLNAPHQSTRQEILDRSLVYLDGKEFGLALGEKKPFDVEQLDKPDRSHPAESVPEKAMTKSLQAPPGATNAVEASANPPAAEVSAPAAPGPPQPRLALRPPALETPPETARPVVPPSPVDVDTLQKKYQAQLDQLSADGVAHFHFVSYAPASLGLFHNQVYLQLTLRNPEPFDKSATSIYKRAAQSFDLFLAPQCKGLLAKIPSDLAIAGIDITVLDQFARTASAAGSSEALEFICPIIPLRQFADADITNQDLIQQSIVLVNGVRIALNLQQVE